MVVLESAGSSRMCGQSRIVGDSIEIADTSRLCGRSRYDNTKRVRCVNMIFG